MRAAMKQALWWLSVVLIGCGGGASGPACGPGTVLTGGECVPTTSGMDACGAGTAQEGNTCVPLDAADSAAGSDAGDTQVDSATDALVDAAGDATSVTCTPSCTKGQFCDELGICQTLPVSASWTCAKSSWADGSVCNCGCGGFDPDCANTALPVTGCGNGTCQDDGSCAGCKPQCTGKICGDDGCGGSCGGCSDPAKPVCVAGQCAACTPNCNGRVCGDDGCGGTCGACVSGTLCAVGQCIFPPPDLSCAGHCGGLASGGCSCEAKCAAKGTCCVDVGVCGCQPACGGKDCGDDGCGGSCGSCGSDAVCQNQQCVIAQCSDATCNGNGACANSACTCQSGFAGKFCQQCASGFVNYPICVTACSAAGDCDDNLPCTQDDCNATFGCTHIPGDATCTDGDACTTGDTCISGACEATLTSGCDDGNPCTADACDKAVGCSHLPGAATACDDGNACTSNDACAGGQCAGTATNCDDGNSCSDDACAPGTGCSHVGNGSACSDGNKCAAGEVCVGLACTSVSPKNCDDGNGCTLDTCDGATGACGHLPASATTVCDDDDLCTASDLCDGNGQCVGAQKVCTLSVASGLVAHFSAAQPSTLAFGADQRVQTWQDQSGSGHALSAVDVAKAPLLVQSGIHGRRALQWTGAAGLTSTAFSYGNTASVFAVICTDSSAGLGTVAAQGGSTGWALAGSSSSVVFTIGGSSNGTASAISASGCYVLSARVTGSGIDLLTASATSGDKSDAATLTSGSGALVLGSDGSAGLLGELLVYDHALSDDERDSVTNYLRIAWGFTPPTPDFVWYDASDAASLVLDTAGNVSQWSDKSGLGRHATPGSSTPPVWFANGTSNGQPAVRFDGASVRLQSASVATSAQMTVFTVFELDNPMPWGSVFSQGHDTYFSLRKDESTPGSVNWHIQNNNDAPLLTYTSGAWKLATAVQDGTTSWFYDDPAKVQQVTQANPIAAGSEVMSLGNSFLGSESMGGFLAEIRAYTTALNRTDRAFVESTLRVKYGL